MSRYELTISTSYVPDWTYVEAVRELFQNAIDNEAQTPENKMEFEYDPSSQTLIISNRTSVLEVNSLLLGVSTKRDEENTIGKHGEGYKIAFMVLAREGRAITVRNYGKREVWEVRLIKSRRFGNERIAVVDINKSIWNKVPNSSLVVEIEGITPYEYEDIKKSNLNIQEDVAGVEVTVDRAVSKVLTASHESGNIYINGLYVCNCKYLNFGYSLSPKIIQLDRDRRMVSDFNMTWASSRLLLEAYKQGDLHKEIEELINKSAQDVQYLKASGGYTYSAEIRTIANNMAKGFIERHGASAVPVATTEQLDRINRDSSRAVLVTPQVSELLKMADTDIEMPEDEPCLADQFTDFLASIKEKLTNSEIEEFEELINKI